jgi:glutamate/tyrosine decarboxylase-like PLP-dependent enzyme
MSTLDPTDWTSLRALGHRMMDDMIDHLAHAAEGPVWQPMPPAIRAGFAAPLPTAPQAPEAVYLAFRRNIAPYVVGNTHPRFMGWVHGGGNAVAMLAELLAGGLNANCGGRDHVGLEVERQVVAWAAAMLGLPLETSGLLVTGSSMANFIATLCARTRAIGPAVRQNGLAAAPLTAYAAASAHRCVIAALDMAGLGATALRKIPVDADNRLDLAMLQKTIDADRAAGAQPFLLVGTAGAVDTGAFDDLAALAAIAKAQSLWFHVDAAFGALAALSPTHRHKVAGIKHADSVAFDFHKWAQVTYDAGCILIRDPAIHLATFAQDTNYLAAADGLAGNQPWPCDLGPDLSRGFRALKIWMTLSTYGTDALAAVVDTTCALAQRLAAHINTSNRLVLLAPVPLNIVCFAITGASNDDIDALVADMQNSGAFAPSTTTLNGRRAIRAAIVNHRTTEADIDAFAAAMNAAAQRFAA